MLSIDSLFSIPETEFHFQYVRSSGPGGQNVNKVNSKAQLHWNFQDSESVPIGVKTRFLQRFPNRITESGEVVIQSDRFRDREKNRDDCLEKLRQMLLLVVHPPKPRKKTKPSRVVREKRKQHKQRASDKKRSRQKRNWD